MSPKVYIFFSFVFFVGSVYAFDSVGNQNHRALTRNAINTLLSRDQYSDLQRFEGSGFLYQDEITGILGGSADEGLGIFGYKAEGAHNSVDRTKTYWYKNEKEWEDQFFLDYKQFEFSAAYRRLGYVLHLLQDIHSPAHEKIIFHGSGSKFPSDTHYVLSPDRSKLPEHDDIIFKTDEFESYANNHPDVSGTFDPAAMDRKYNGNCRKFWLTSKEVTGISDTWGLYGHNALDPNGCSIPFSEAQSVDWFQLGNPSDINTITYTQLRLAQESTLNELEQISKTLPPLVALFKQDPLRPNIFQISVLENRTSRLKQVALKISRSGNLIGTILLGTNIAMQSNWDQTSLPWIFQKEFNWDGKVNGSFLPVGDYIVQLEALDQDGNSTPDDALVPRQIPLTITSPGVVVLPVAPLVVSSSHPDPTQSYGSSNIQLSWSMAQPVVGYSFILDWSPGTIPDDFVDASNSSIQYSSVGYGTFYFHVKAKLVTGNWTSTAHFPLRINDLSPPPTPPPPVDYTPPSVPTVLVPSSVLCDGSQISASWAASDPQSGIAYYEYAIGTSLGGTDIIGFSNAGANTGVTVTGLKLDQGKTYYVSVRATNNAGLKSAVGSSVGVEIQAVPANAYSVPWTVQGTAVETYSQTTRDGWDNKNFYLHINAGGSASYNFTLDDSNGGCQDPRLEPGEGPVCRSDGKCVINGRVWFCYYFVTVDHTVCSSGDRYGNVNSEIDLYINGSKESTLKTYVGLGCYTSGARSILKSYRTGNARIVFHDVKSQYQSYLTGGSITVFYNQWRMKTVSGSNALAQSVNGVAKVVPGQTCATAMSPITFSAQYPSGVISNIDGTVSTADSSVQLTLKKSVYTNTLSGVVEAKFKDQSPPQIANASPALAGTGGTVRLAAAVSDASPTQQTLVLNPIRAPSKSIALDQGYYDYSVPHDSTGTVTYFFKAVDSVGNIQVSPSYRLAVNDAEPPKITALSPYDKLFYSSGAVKLDENVHYKVNDAVSARSGLIVTGGHKQEDEAHHSSVIQAYDEAHNDATHTFQFVIDKTPPTMPAELYITQMSSSSLTFHWAASWDNEGVESYHATLAQDQDFISTLPSYEDFDLGLTTRAVIQNLDQEGPYFLKVWAQDKAKNKSKESSLFTTLTLPSLPVGLSAVALSTQSIYWVWPDVDREEFYNIEITSGGWVVSDLAMDTTFYKSADLLPNTSYSVMLRAINAWGSAVSTPVVAWTWAAVPNNFKMVEVSTNAIVLSCTPDNFVSYQIERSTVADQSRWQTIAVDSFADGVFVDTSVTALVHYSYRIGAINGSGVLNTADYSAVVATTIVIAPEVDAVAAKISAPRRSAVYGETQLAVRGKTGPGGNVVPWVQSNGNIQEYASVTANQNGVWHANLTIGGGEGQVFTLGSYVVFESAKSPDSNIQTFSLDLEPSAEIYFSTTTPLRDPSPQVTVQSIEPLTACQLDLVLDDFVSTRTLMLSSTDQYFWTATVPLNSKMNGPARWLWTGTDLDGFDGHLLTGTTNFEILLDTVAPVAEIRMSPGSPLRGGVLVAVELKSNKALSSCYLAVFSATGVLNSWATLVSDAVSSGTVWVGTYTFSSNFEGAASWQWMGVDYFGNSGTLLKSGANFAIDNTAPEVRIQIVPSSPLNPEFALEQFFPPFTSNVKSGLKVGAIHVVVEATEDLAFSTLTVTAGNVQPFDVALVRENSRRWSGDFSVTSDWKVALGEFHWRGQDWAGNLGENILSGGNFEVDTLPPAGSFLINGGAFRTEVSTVTLTFNVEDFTALGRKPPTFVEWSFDNWQTVQRSAFSANKTVTVPQETREFIRSENAYFQTISVRFIDAVGNASAITKNGIILAPIHPTGMLLLRKR